VDRAESERELAFAVNAEAPGVLAKEAARLGAPIVHYSTDYVYDGNASRPYLESDPTNPVSVYGASKLEGDCRVLSSGAAHVILRTSWVYATRGRNFLRTMLRLARERDTLRVVSDQIGTPTPARLIAEVTSQLVARFVVGDRVDIPESSFGVYHLTARGATSWHGFARAILAGDPASWEHRCHDVVAIATSEYPTAARRPAYSVLATDRLESTFGFRLPDWDHALALVLQELPVGAGGR
jgi:dTDP-4-dehydrorhamnose reductase